MSNPQTPAVDRRSALLRLGALCGLALTTDVLAAVAAVKASGPQPAFLTPDELALTGVLAELIIPRTDTPGAYDVAAHVTLDHLLDRCATAEDQAAFRALLARLDGAARVPGGQRFVALPAARQTALLRALDDGAAPFDKNAQRSFRRAKSLVAFAYYTSEPGASQELAYLPFPGGFTGSVQVTPSTRTWAL